MTKRIFLVLFAFIGIIVLGLGVRATWALPEQPGAPLSPTVLQWVTEYVAQQGSVGSHVSLAFDAETGTPWISYYDATNQDLVVAHYVVSGGNCDANDEWDCEVVDSVGDVGKSSSIDVYHDPESLPITLKVGVSYFDETNDALKYAVYSCFITQCEWHIYTIQDASFLGSYGEYSSLKFNQDGYPMIAYTYYFSNHNLKLASYKGDGTGNCGEGSAAGYWECITVDDNGDVGEYVAIDYDTFSSLYIAYYDATNTALKYAYYTGFGGNCGPLNDDWMCSTIEGAGDEDLGKFVSIHVPTSADDALQFAYYDATNGKLRYAVDVEGTPGNCGAGGFQCDDIEEIGTGLSQVGISLITDSDNDPMIAYMSTVDPQGPSILKIATPVPYIGNCGPQALFYLWQCDAVDVGSLFHQEAYFASIALDPAGWPLIAYSELDSHAFPFTYDLKIAYLVDFTYVYLPFVVR